MTKMFWMQKDHVKDGSKIVSDFHRNLLAESYDIEDIYGENYENLDYVDQVFSKASKDSIVFIVQIWHKKHYDFIRKAKKYGLKVWVICHTHVMYNDLVPMVCKSDADFIPADGYSLTPYLYPNYVDRIITLTSHDYNYYKSIGCKDVVNIPQVITDFDESFKDIKRTKDENCIISISSINNYKHSYLMLHSFIEYIKSHPKSELRYKIITQTSKIPEKFKKLAETCDHVEIINNLFGREKYQQIINSKGLLHFGNLETGPLVYLEANIMNIPIICFENSSTDVKPRIPVYITDFRMKECINSALYKIDNSINTGNFEISEYNANLKKIEFVKMVLNNEYFNNNCWFDLTEFANTNTRMYNQQKRIVDIYPEDLRNQ